MHKCARCQPCSRQAPPPSVVFLWCDVTRRSKKMRTLLAPTDTHLKLLTIVRWTLAKRVCCGFLDPDSGYNTKDECSGCVLVNHGMGDGVEFHVVERANRVRKGLEMKTNKIYIEYVGVRLEVNNNNWNCVINYYPKLSILINTNTL